MERKESGPRDQKVLLQPTLVELGVPPAWADTGSGANRRRSTIHSYNLVHYSTLPRDQGTQRQVATMTSARAYKNVLATSTAFMFIYTGFVSLQGLQSTLHYEDGVGVVSLSCFYGSTVVSCLLAPWLINTISAKWTMAAGLALFAAYFAANFYPVHALLAPLGIVLGLMAGPLWSAQATSLTSVALIHAQHRGMAEADDLINRFMGIFWGVYRTSQIWGNLITTLVLHPQSNRSLLGEEDAEEEPWGWPVNVSEAGYTCGAYSCRMHGSHLGMENVPPPEVPDATRYMLLSVYLGCGVMGVVTLIVLLDKGRPGHKEADPEFSMSSREIFLSTLKMLKDSRCQLLIPLVVFVGLEQGFMFSDFTRAYVACALGVEMIGPILICFGTVSSLSAIVIGFIARHIKRFLFITAGATFAVGLLIVLWLWRPSPLDTPNFYVVAGCLGLCDAIWQTQTYTLFGVLFTYKQEAAFASYRMFHASGCAIAFGLSYYLCVEIKVYLLAGCLVLGLALYAVIEMKVQLQSQHIRDIVAL